MAESSESEFEGFELRDVEEAEQRYLSKLIELDDLDSDIDISDVSDVEDEVNNDSESSDDETVLADLARWTENVRPTRIKDFTGPTPGPTSTMDEDKIEYDFFNLIWPEIIFEEIAKETNAYASKCIETRPNASWYDTNAGEMKAFFGAMIILGVLPAPAQDMYWLKDRMFHLSCIETKFSRTRFENIQRYLHIADTSTNPPRDQIGHDKLAHVRPLLDKIKATVRDEYNGHREVAIDEAMVGFSGRLGFKQYVPLKPTKRGIKIWVRADPHNGYINDFQVYTGKVRGAPEKDLGARVVLDLMGPLFGLGHHVYCDSFFTSPDLFLRLWKEDTYACGTVRMNRKGLPQGLDKIKLKEQGQSIVRQKGDLTVSVWRDKKNITLLSTNCSSGQAEQVSRKQKDGSTKEVPCPLVVKLYNMYMNGVDHADQLRSTYNTARKSLKWWKYLLFFLFDISIVNAFILMRESKNHELRTKNNKVRQRTQLEFRMKLAHSMLDPFESKRKRTSDIQEAPRQNTCHWPAVMEKKKTCKMCTINKKRSEPITGCEQCNINLCTKCFKPWHRLKFPNLF